MRTETFPPGYDVLARFPGARAYARGQGWISYLAEHRGVPYLIVAARPAPPQDGPAGVTVMEFDDERERAFYLVESSGRPRTVPSS